MCNESGLLVATERLERGDWTAAIERASCGCRAIRLSWTEKDWLGIEPYDLDDVIRLLLDVRRSLKRDAEPKTWGLP